MNKSTAATYSLGGRTAVSFDDRDSQLNQAHGDGRDHEGEDDQIPGSLFHSLSPPYLTVVR
jgi:hypothetical protein